MLDLVCGVACRAINTAHGAHRQFVAPDDPRALISTPHMSPAHPNSAYKDDTKISGHQSIKVRTLTVAEHVHHNVVLGLVWGLGETHKLLLASTRGIAQGS